MAAATLRKSAVLRPALQLCQFTAFRSNELNRLTDLSLLDSWGKIVWTTAVIWQPETSFTGRQHTARFYTFTVTTHQIAAAVLQHSYNPTLTRSSVEYHYQHNQVSLCADAFQMPKPKIMRQFTHLIPKSPCASISLHGWGEWPISPPPVLSSSHSPSFFPPPPERCKVSQQVWNRVMNWTWTCVSPYFDLLD